MKKIIFGSLFVSASLLAAPYGTMTPTSTMDSTKTVNAAAVQESPKDRFTTTEDHKLASQVRVQIAEVIGAPKAAEIILVIDQGDVKLLGRVQSDDIRRKIIEAVHQVKGVKSIHNTLIIDKNSPIKK